MSRLSRHVRRFSPFFYNPVTYAGVFIALLFFLVECFLFAIDFFMPGDNLYLGMLTYIFLPPFLILGLILIPAGALWKRRRIRQGKSSLEVKPIVIDPSLSTHRNALIVFLAGTFILVLMSLIGAYRGYEYTESVEFCGITCHAVMEPEHTAYLNSPHAKVKCVDCHVGEGADNYIESKIAGTRQMFKAMTGTYPKPVPTPVHNLRPAQETCKQCHWPGRFFGSVDRRRSYFAQDEKNTRWDIRMFLNVGGGKDQPAGVHAHMNLDHDIYYAAEDERRQKIAWVKSVDKQGRETVYTTPNSKWKDTPPPAEQVRQMDCIDCHNRATHQFRAPYRLLNESLQYGHIDPEIPFIKQKAMELMSKKYASADEAAASIDKELRAYYAEEHADYAAAHPDKIDAAVKTVRSLFERNIFPYMNTRWDTHPDNIGHLAAPGCFRCHDDNHKTIEGRLITKDCASCHTIVEQGPAGATERNIDGLEFKHPDGTEDWKDADCTDCHTGGA